MRPAGVPLQPSDIALPGLNAALLRTVKCVAAEYGLACRRD